MRECVGVCVCVRVCVRAGVCGEGGVWVCGCGSELGMGGEIIRDKISEGRENDEEGSCIH